MKRGEMQKKISIFGPITIISVLRAFVLNLAGRGGAFSVHYSPNELRASENAQRPFHRKIHICHGISPLNVGEYFR